jgi:hypothetical protein
MITPTESERTDNGVCAPEYHERAKRDPEWWAACESAGTGMGLEFRHCRDCVGVPSTLARPVEVRS